MHHVLNENLSENLFDYYCSDCLLSIDPPKIELKPIKSKMIEVRSGQTRSSSTCQQLRCRKVHDLNGHIEKQFFCQQIQTNTSKQKE